MHLIWAFRAFFRALVHGEAALATAPAAAGEAPPPPPPEAFQHSTEPAIQLLAILQQQGRLVDFLMEDVRSFSDAEIGAAARQIHEGCRAVLDERIKLARIVEGNEGATTRVDPGFNASHIALLGNVTGNGPWSGTIRHRGWRVEKLDLPTVPPGADPTIVQPAEVELT